MAQTKPRAKQVNGLVETLGYDVYPVFATYATKAASTAAFAGIPTDAYYIVTEDESVTGSPMTRYRKTGGVAVLDANLNQLRTDLANPAAGFGSKLVAFKQNLVGAIARWVFDKLSDAVSISDFGAIGDGASHPLSERFGTLAAAQAQYPLATSLTQEIDLVATRTAYAASKRVLFKEGTYNFGNLTADNVAVDFSGRGDGLALKTDGRVRFICNTTGAAGTPQIPRFFQIKNNSHCHFEPVEFFDAGFDATLSAAGTFRGAYGFYVANDAGQSFGNLSFEKITGNRVLCPIAVVRNAGVGANDRVRSINIGQIIADDCTRGFSSQNQGDFVRIGLLHAKRAVRCYFVYGVTDHDVNIFNEDGRGSTGSLNIARFPGSPNTCRIKARYTSRNNTVGFTHVTINHLDLLGGEITNLDLDIDIEAGAIYTPVYFVNFDGSGNQTQAASTNVVRDVDIRAVFDGQALPIQTFASYSAKGRLEIERGVNVSADAATDTAFRLNSLVRGATLPMWGASGTTPAIGNGSITYSVDTSRAMSHYTMTLNVGSTTTFGTGEWFFDFPKTSATSQTGAAYVLDSGFGYYQGVAKVNSGNNRVSVFPGGGGGSAFGPTVPITWAAGDQLIFSIPFSR